MRWLARAFTDTLSLASSSSHVSPSLPGPRSLTRNTPPLSSCAKRAARSMANGWALINVYKSCSDIIPSFAVRFNSTYFFSFVLYFYSPSYFPLEPRRNVGYRSGCLCRHTCLPLSFHALLFIDFLISSRMVGRLAGRMDSSSGVISGSGF